MPAKNESEFIARCLNSIITQSCLPTKLIIVDDSSTDNTKLIAEEYSKKYTWMRVLQKSSPPEIRSGGSKVVETFNHGFAFIHDDEWEFIVKLDADLELPTNYFESIINTFASDEKIGITGGMIYNKVGSEFIKEGTINYHVRGAFKAYRKACFQDIGGLKPIWGWDGIDEMGAIYNGWTTKVLEIMVKHYRITSSAYDPKTHAFMSGYEAYRIRMNFILFLARAVHKLFARPYLLYSYYFMKGFLHAIVLKPDRIIDKDFASFITKFHFKRVLNIFQ